VQPRNNIGNLSTANPNPIIEISGESSFEIKSAIKR